MEKAVTTLTITRTFDAPRSRVWEACTKEEELIQWWGQPKEATMPYSEIDFRVGGSFHYKVELPQGMVVWGKAIYTKIVKPEIIVYEDYYSNEQGDLLDTAELPKLLITLTFEEEGEKTKLTVCHEGTGIGVHTVDQYRQGWGEVLDRLAQTVK